MLDALHIIAERRIAAAIENDELQFGDWKGRELPMEDDGLIPPELRMAYKILKNAHFLPPELNLKKDIAQLEDLIARTEDEHTRLRQMKKLNVLVLKMNALRPRPVQLEEQERYFPRIVERLSVANKHQGEKIT